MRFETVLKETVRRTSDVTSFRFPRPDGFEYLPGQYMYVEIRKKRGLRKHFTISSSPTEGGHIEFTKKLTGHEFSNSLTELKIGDGVLIDGPKGDFTFHGEHSRVALFCGGIGITPFRSIIRYCTDMRLDPQITLLCSNSSVDAIVFREELEEMQRQNSHLIVAHTITEENEAWEGLRGRITARMIESLVTDYRERFSYVSGPPQMVEDIEKILRREMRIPAKHVKTELFLGY